MKEKPPVSPKLIERLLHLMSHFSRLAPYYAFGPIPAMH